ncbi:peptide synthetase [Streptomyces albofaciens JCM 4342]|uniref:condensation domain-containing protein n=1 Tax=Streptomyces albofaciens TaxID=66866 RepID=UPI0012395D68|nr:condensation domain-containing protein [Streptomyces albofaciens]KAA6223719.1 peptide synthetase [Streptomyces albofaciens JCM 4342]
MRTGDVAIIGAAGIFPDAADLETFHDNLRAGRDSVGGPGRARLHAGDDPGERYLAMGYLDRIDLFDHELFGIPRREAELMDPHQRLLLQLTHQAIESAGYAPATLRGSAASVLLAAVETGPDWVAAETDRDVVQLLGTSTAALAARLSYLFDLQGPALVVDTACSSALTAVHLAVRQLRDGEAPLAIVGGINLLPPPVRKADWTPLPGLESSDERCRPFDADANGMTAGEGGGIVVLKPLSRALADGDNVLAVLKGVAVNHNGYRAATMAAPSQAAQAAVLAEAWRDGEVGAETIGYVECHGSGTPLGDVVEVDALRRAFTAAGVTAPQCAIGSVKANIGHLGNAAAIAGLFKVMAALRYGVHYPAVNFTAPNPLIDFTGPVYVNDAPRPWPDAPSGRRAGLSSWGMTGTNVHAVLEQAPAPAPHETTAPDTELVTVSARSAAALDRYRTRLAAFAERTGQPLRAVAHALNRGRDDHPYRLAVTATTTGELAARLRAAAVPEAPAPDAPRPVLLFSGDALLDDAAWARLCADFPVPVGCAELDATTPDPAGRTVVRQYALHRVAESLGLTDAALIGSGTGNLTVRVARGRLTLAEAVAEAAARRPDPAPDRARLEPVAAGLARDGALLVALAGGGVLARETGALVPDLPVVDLAGDGSRAEVLARLGRLYTLGAALDWERHYRGTAIRRIEAPTYPFEPTRCPFGRPRTEPAAPSRPAGTAPAAPSGLAETERRVAAVWADLLDRPDAGPDSDYFMLGGTSLVGVGLLRRLQQDFGVPVTFADLYAHPTVRALAGRLHELTAEARGNGAPAAVPDDRPIPRIGRGGPLPLSFGQEPLWYLDQVNPGSPLYNVPAPLHLTGPLDTDALQDALADMAARHEVLRSVFLTDDDSAPYVAFTAPEPLLAVLDVSRMPEEQRGPRVRTLIRDAVAQPFDLTRDTLLRVLLIKRAAADHVLVLTFHHTVFDGGSTALFTRDLAEFYRARSTGTEARLPELPVQYQDYAAWQRSLPAGPRWRRSLDFWRAELAGLDRPELPLDRPRPDVQSYDGEVLPFLIDAENAERVREYSRRHGVTTFVTMLAVLDALVHLWSGHRDIVIGVATSGRVHPDLQDVLGYFNNLPPFRTDTTADLTFDELVRRCAGTVAGVLDHEEIPVAQIVSAAGARRDLARHPLYDVTYTYQNVPQYEGGLAGVEISRYADTDVGGVVPGTAKFDLSFGIVDAGTGPMIGELDYATALFDRATADRLVRWFPELVAAAMAEPGRTLGELEPEGATGEARAEAHAVCPAPEPAPVPSSAPEPSRATEPPGDTEAVLRKLFGDLVGGTTVRPDDDFFTIGGDSVMSIQLVARARRAGVMISQRDVFEHRTAAAIAAVATAAAAPPRTEADGGADRRIPLTPVMREFAGRAGMPGLFAQTATLAVPAGTDPAVLAAAFRAVRDHHAMLRARLVGEAGTDPATWALTVPEAEADGADGAAAPVRRVDAAELGPRELAALLEKESRAAAGRLDPRAGSTAQLVLLDRGTAEEGRLLLAVHHLVVDVLSWKAVLHDLEAAYEALAAGEPVSLPPVPTSFGQWARTLASLARTAQWQDELPAWESIMAPGEPLLGGRALDAARDTVTHAGHVSVSLPAPVTAALLTTVPAAFYSGTGDLLLATLAAAVAAWRTARGQGTGPVLVDVEGHGREPLGEDMDLSRTVGWFTCVYPVRLDPGTADLAEVRAGGPAAGHLVKRIKEQLGAVPGNGLGHGALRYFAPGTGSALAGLPAPLIGFNYLGGLLGAGTAPDGGWRLLGLGGEIAEHTALGHALETSGTVVDGPDGPELHLAVTGSRDLVDESAARELCQDWAALLTGLAAYADRPGAGGHVPSDFPLVALSQRQIEQLEAGIGE